MVMETIQTLTDKTGLTKAAVIKRIIVLELPAHYDSINGKVVRIFTDEEADKVINYKAKKPGRKRSL